MYSVFLLFVGIAYVTATGFIIEMTQEEISKAEDLRKGIDMTVERLNAKNNRLENKKRLVTESLVRASSQIVAGILYRAEVRLVPSICDNTDENSNKKIEDCPAIGNGATMHCKFTIWSRPWLPDTSKQILIRGIHCAQN